MMGQLTTSGRVSEQFTAVDIRITNWLARHGITVLRVGLGVVFLWFGVLKFMPGVSAAEDLAGRTIALLTFGLIDPSASRIMLACWESLIGLGLVTGYHLQRAGRSFVMLDANARVGDTWRQRYDSLRLFTPAYGCSLDGYRYPSRDSTCPAGCASCSCSAASCSR